MTTKTAVCAGCQGVISGTRRFSLARSMETHEHTCPSRRGMSEPTKKKETKK